MKKGFTLVELITVISIISILMLLGIPSYLLISNNIKQNMYESKVKELLAKGEEYAEETNSFAFSVNTLLEEGKVSADNESGNILDPRDKRKMNCDIIEIHYKDNSYEGNYIENSTCLSDEELNNNYGVLELVLLDENGEEIVSDNAWLSYSKIKVSYRIKETYQESVALTSLYWSGEEEKSCKDDLSDCNYYEVSTSTSKQVTVKLMANYEINHQSINAIFTKKVWLDVEEPKLQEDSLIYETEISTPNKQKVSFKLTDNYGSGLQSYYIVNAPTCDISDSDKIYKEENTFDGLQTIYLANGIYYICAKDKVGNQTTNAEENKIEIKNVDSNIPKVKVSAESKEQNYHSKEVTLKIQATDDNPISELKMCLSKKGYLQDCQWQDYVETVDWNLDGDYDGGTRTIYVTVMDKAGNIGNAKTDYVVYKKCSKTIKNYTSNYTSCSASCGGGIKSRSYNDVDEFLGNVCSNGKEEQKCNTQACGPITYTNLGNHTTKLHYDYTFTNLSVTYFAGTYTVYIAFTDENKALNGSRYGNSLSESCIVSSKTDKCNYYLHTAGQTSLELGSGSKTLTNLKTYHQGSYQYYLRKSGWYSPGVQPYQQTKVADSVDISWNIKKVNSEDMSSCYSCDSDTMQKTDLRVVLDIKIINPIPYKINGDPCESYAKNTCRSTGYFGDDEIKNLYLTNMGIGVIAHMNDGERGDNDHRYGPIVYDIKEAIEAAIKN